MKLEMPLLDLAPGRILCLHVPDGFQDAGEALERELLKLASRQRKTAAISRPAEVGARCSKFSLKQRSAEWLAHAGGISEEESGQIIADFGVRVADQLAYNAGTPRCLLAIAATLIRKPEVVAYSTQALDGEGCWMVHRFIASKCNHLCVVHLSYPTVFGDGSPHPRQCPAGAQCVEFGGRWIWLKSLHSTSE